MFLIPLNVFADILFINLNLSNKELATALKAAKERGEKLRVIPEVLPDDTLKIEALRNEISSLELKKKNPNEKDIAKKTLYSDKLDELNSQLSVITKKYIVDNSHLDNILTEFDNNPKVQLSSLIISGHHSKYFFGDNSSELDYEKLEETFNNHPEAIKNLKSIYLWGCYTLTKKRVVFWKRVVPSAYILSGWDDSAPKEDKKLDHEALYKLLVNEQKESLKTDLKKSISFFNSITGVKQSSHTICIGSNYINNKGDQNITDFLKSCSPEEIEKFKKNLEIVEEYRKASSKEFAEVPKSTASSILREIYNYGRKIEHCDEFVETELNKLIFLIFDKQVRKNIAKYFEKDFKLIDNIFEKINLPKVSQTFQKEGLTRTEALSEMNKISQVAYNSESSHLSQSEKKFLEQTYYKLEKMLGQQKCMKPIWIEEVDAMTLGKNIDCMFKVTPTESNILLNGAGHSTIPFSGNMNINTGLNLNLEQ
jgi:hypothetical protein